MHPSLRVASQARAVPRRDGRRRSSASSARWRCWGCWFRLGARRGDGAARPRRDGGGRVGVRTRLLRTPRVRTRHVRRGGGALGGFRAVFGLVRGEGDRHARARRRRGVRFGRGGPPAGRAGDSDSEEDLDSDGEDAGGRRWRPATPSSRAWSRKRLACRAVSSYTVPRLQGHIGEFLDKMGQMANMHEIVRAQAHGARRGWRSARSSPRPRRRRTTFPVVDAALNAAHRALAEDDDRDSASAAMESAAEVIKSVAAARRESRTSSARDTSRPLRSVSGRPRAARHGGDDDEDDFALGRGGDDDGTTTRRRSSDRSLEGCAELLPALAAVAGGARAGFEPRFAALLRRASDTRPEVSVLWRTPWR